MPRTISLNLLPVAPTQLMVGLGFRPCNFSRLRGVLAFVLRAIMGARIIKAAISLAAIATSAISVFAVSWIGLALLGY